MILLVYRAVPEDTRIEAFLNIFKSATLQVTMRGHTRSMLMSAHHIGNTTAALILLDPTTEMVFYLKETESVKEYTQLDFYSKSSKSSFDAYLINLRKYHSHCVNINKHLDSVTTVLVEAGLWSRLALLLQITELQAAMGKLIFVKLYQHADREVIFRAPTPELSSIVEQLFKVQQQCGSAWDDEVFRAGFYLNPEQAMTIMRPEKIALSTLRACVKHHPSKAFLLLEGNAELDK